MKSEIVNIVATASLNQVVDLAELRKFDPIFHDSDVYGGRVAYFKTTNMQGKVSIFTSGKMISIGTKSEETAIQELEDAKAYFMKKGIISDVSLEPKIRNVVVCIDFGKQVTLEDLALENHVIYEPEQFPGAIFRILEPYKATILIFASGKTVVTGLTSANQIEPVKDILKTLLNKLI